MQVFIDIARYSQGTTTRQKRAVMHQKTKIQTSTRKGDVRGRLYYIRNYFARLVVGLSSQSDSVSFCENRTESQSAAALPACPATDYDSAWIEFCVKFAVKDGFWAK